MTSDDRSESIVLARRVAHLAHERRGTEVVVMDVRALVDYADAFIIVSGQSARQNLAIAEHIVKELKAQKTYAISKSGLDTGTWICLDLGDIVVHVFDPDTRARYDLELLWADAPRVDVEPEPAVTEGVGAPAVTDTPAPQTETAISTSVVDEDAGETKSKPKRRRAVRRAAVEEADADNAPDSERPADGEPEAGAQDEAQADEAPMPRKQKNAPSRQPIARPLPRANDESDDSEWVPIKKVAKAAKAAPAKAVPVRVPSKATPAKSAPPKSAPPKAAPAKTAPAKSAPAKSAPAKSAPAKAVTPKAEPVKAPVAKPPKPARITKASAEAFNRKLAAKKKSKK